MEWWSNGESTACYGSGNETRGRPWLTPPITPSLHSAREPNHTHSAHNTSAECLPTPHSVCRLLPGLESLYVQRFPGQVRMAADPVLQRLIRGQQLRLNLSLVQ